jgi:hypothetical protein
MNTKVKQISFWQWIGRVVPMVTLVIIFLFYFYGDNNLLDNGIIIIITLLSFIPIIWWWWAMDVMKWLSTLYHQTIEIQNNIMSDLKDIKVEIQENKKNNNE